MKMRQVAGFMSALVVATSLQMPSGKAAVENPYAYVVGISAMNICLVRFGYLTTEQAVDLMFQAAKDEGISEYQLSNLIKSQGFNDHMEEAITSFGGCRAMITRFVERKGRSKRSIAGSSGLMSTDIYYGPNPEKIFSKLNHLNP